MEFIQVGTFLPEVGKHVSQSPISTV